MGTELRKLLDKAKGTPEHVIAILLDIRGFTPFCEKTGESLDVANFLKRVYIRIIDDYFPKASFYKPTGDGLLIVIPINKEPLKDAVVNIMEKCLNLLQNFGRLCEGDDMIYFPTPDKVGIGMSRGTACCISSSGTILDYSGKVINLASRLNDFARPCGIVFDSKLGLSLLPKDVQELFLCENVYVRGIAEDKPIAICFAKQYTIIPPSRKQPLKEPQWSVETFGDTYKGIKEAISSRTKYFTTHLKHKPLDEKQIHIELRYDIGGSISRSYYAMDTASEGVSYLKRGIKHYVYIDLSVLIKMLDKDGLEDDTKLRFEVIYPIAPNGV
jgi:class 3 adenylate cyclase